MAAAIFGSLAYPSLANVAPLVRGNVQGGNAMPEKSADVAVLRERLDVAIEPPRRDRFREMPPVTVTAEYELKNESAVAQTIAVAFPYAGAFGPSRRGFEAGEARTEQEEAGFGSNVRLDGEALKFADEPIDLPITARHFSTAYLFAPDKQDGVRFKDAFVRWTQTVPGLAESLAEYAKIVPSSQTYADAREQFEQLARASTARRGLTHELQQYMSARAKKKRPDDSEVRQLIAEADPAFRTPRGDSFDSTLNGGQPIGEAKFEAFCRTIDEWIDGRPGLKEAFARLQQEVDLQEASRTFVRERIGRPIQEHMRWSPVAHARCLNYIQSAYNPHPQFMRQTSDGKREWEPKPASLPIAAPDEWLVSQVDQDINRAREAKIKSADETLARFGFDATFLSPLTGRGYSQRMGWRDDSVWPLLGLKPSMTRDEAQLIGAPDSSEPGKYPRMIESPRSQARLIRFNVPIEANQTRVLRVQYRCLLEADDWFYASDYSTQVAHFRYILTTARYWKSFGPIDVTLSMPNNGLAVLDPPPEATEVSADKRTRVMRMTLKNPDRNLRLAWLPANQRTRSALFGAVTVKDVPDLERIANDRTITPGARMVLEVLTQLAKQQPSDDRLWSETEPAPLPANVPVSSED